MSTFYHIKGVTVTANFSNCKNYRYRLSIKKNDVLGTKKVCVIMQNPSIAGEDIADLSVQKLEKLIFTMDNYEEFREVNEIIIVNQFADIQTTDFNGFNSVPNKENDQFVREAIDSSDIILIAWGKSNPYQEQINKINSWLENTDKLLLQTERHPSRMGYDDCIKPYNIY
ncbi:DUF1643 domain-containing protein [Pasteurella atlantica]|uniref:DUF1643 domain-containing protein n=1 Tax=Phocoenobacter skyensis TaxID=97481 RepID=A0AAJ6NF33_9PAST|nr:MULTISPECIES: DUF1643 domain-containing protein [Pasteurella]MDP8034089.1 DUF1643 domain-containing protein [Pasteurella atlantica]MDP8036005.1 DUF1643 domain-containing protein [Pasteurella atlantica]MDP8037955.1 DUF1643 domain-containing protein [Pasteurella atlantica]MDP8048327.1 DUF1643 domain-containing protein [Pasteurella atlantica]MDP8050267.1 DUF1643 domain-containing protein [Pasteurella atlantica]